MKLILLLAAAYIAIGFLLMTAAGCVIGIIEVRKSKRWWKSNLYHDIGGHWDTFEFTFLVAFWPIVLVTLFLWGAIKSMRLCSEWIVLRFSEWFERLIGGQP